MPFQVLLVNTNRMKPAVAPLALDYLADPLAAAGFGVEVLDLCFEDEPPAAIDACLRGFSPDLVAVTLRNTDDCYCTGQDFFLPSIKEILDHIRSRTQAPVLLGGVGFSLLPDAILDFCGLDLGIVGDGEEALPALARVLERGEDYRQVPGLVHRTEDGWVRNPARFTALDALPPRRRRAIDNLRYFREGGQAGFESKRGCPMDCLYCADPVAKGHRLRLLPPRRVADELQALVAQGIDCLHTCDSEFNLPPEHAQAVCEEMARRKLPVTWYAYCSPVPFTRELATGMQRAGCVGINFGVDSGNDQILATLRRTHQADDLRQTARLCREQGLTFMFDLLLGGPGETRETVRETIDLMRELQPDRVGVAMGVRLYPGTELARLAAQEGVGPQNPNLRGTMAPDLLAPIFYLSRELGDDPFGYVADLVGDEPRFFLPAREQAERNYNYNDNSVLVEAIRHGYRGAYWDILRRLAEAG